jgi:polysaccharide export outer membrane protein
VPVLRFGLGAGGAIAPTLAPADAVRLSIVEARAGGQFSGAKMLDEAAAGSRASTIPDQQVGSDGSISVLYIGGVRIAGLSQTAPERRIQAAREGRAIQPQVVPTASRQTGSSVTLAGEVTKTGRISHSQAGDRILDVLSTAGRLKVPVDAAMIILLREGYTVSVPMSTIADDPNENIFLAPGASRRRGCGC